MAFDLSNLDEPTRLLMLEEFEMDSKAGTVVLSKVFSVQGASNYPAWMRAAIANGTDVTLTAALSTTGTFNATETYTTSTGKVMTRKVPINAAERFAEGEFNRFYARALCRRAIADGTGRLEVCRVKAVTNPRAESEAKIGTLVNAEVLLNDLRKNLGVEPALGIPAGPNSGLSVRLVISR
jgi:hypothetical protein